MKISPNLSKMEHWKLCVTEWMASNKSVRQWCIENSIPQSTFIYWKDKLSIESLNKESFVEILEEEKSTGVAIHCKGFEIYISKEFDEQTLSRCLKLIRSSSC